jgi:hypothetical protein
MLDERVELDQRAGVEQPFEPLARESLAALALALHRALVARVPRPLAQSLCVRELLGGGVRDWILGRH